MIRIVLVRVLVKDRQVLWPEVPLSKPSPQFRRVSVIPTIPKLENDSCFLPVLSQLPNLHPRQIHVWRGSVIQLLQTIERRIEQVAPIPFMEVPFGIQRPNRRDMHE